MHKVENSLYDTILMQHKIRKEGDFYIVFFPESGDYYALNEIGVDILEFFFQCETDELFAFLKDSYGELSAPQRYIVLDFVGKLCSLKIIEKRY